MKKQFFRVKQLADQTFLRADKTEVLNYAELQFADQKVDYLRTALSAIAKKIPHQSQNNDYEKRIKKCIEYHLANVFNEHSNPRKNDSGGFQEEPECRLFQSVLKDCGDVEHFLAKEYAEHEKQVEELVGDPIQKLLDEDIPNISKQKRNLAKYILDKDSATNRYNSTKKEAIKEDLDEADNKVGQNRDVLASEMYNFLAKENDLSGYILQLLKCQRAYHDSALKHLQEVIPKLEKRIGDSSIKHVYGISLKEHLRVTEKRIAFPLEICISALSKLGLSEEGILRIGGTLGRVKRLRAAIDSGCIIELIPEYQEVHVLASALKMYLRELPDPLLTSSLYNDWMQVMQKPENERLEIVKRLISSLPQENYENLAYLVQFLAKVAAHKEENRMSPSNIAIVMAPNLLWDKNEPLNMGNYGTINKLVEFFIREVNMLFPDDVSKLVGFSFLKQEDESRPAAITNQVEFSASTENINITDSPKPNSRKKKTPAPVPPNSILSKTEEDFVINEKSSVLSSYPSGSSTLNRPSKSKDTAPTKTSVGVNTDERRKSLTGQEETHKSLVSLDNTKTVEHKYVTQPVVPIQVSKAKPVQPIVAQNANCDKSFKTTVTHQVSQQQAQPQKPVAAPRSIDGDKNPTIIRSSSIRIDMGNRSEEVQLRKPEVALKPEIPARPASLQKRSSIDYYSDPTIQRTQCSVYSVANKLQPNIVNLSINEKFQPGHDNQITEKQKFLGQHPMSRSSLENKFADINSNNKPGLPPKLAKSNEKMDTTKSSEDLGEKLNGNKKSSHVRTRSDGNLIELSDGGSLVQTPPSPRSLSKPTQPPPPPPVNINKKEPDSTDL